nr:uncharacterized protein LOC124818787 isoform X2 [Hydra vulgaris]
MKGKLKENLFTKTCLKVEEKMKILLYFSFFSCVLTLKCSYQIFLFKATVDECHPELQDSCATINIGAVLSGLSVKIVYKACAKISMCGEICNQTIAQASGFLSGIKIASCDSKYGFSNR